MTKLDIKVSLYLLTVRHYTCLRLETLPKELAFPTLTELNRECPGGDVGDGFTECEGARDMVIGERIEETNIFPFPDAGQQNKQEEKTDLLKMYINQI